MRIAQSLFISLAISSAVGCVADRDVETSGDRTATLALSADLLGATDIGGVHFLVTEVPCGPGPMAVNGGPATWEATTDFEDMYLPGGIPAFEDKPFDADSTHMFADSYFLLPAGCYDVLVTPLDQAGAPSGDCFTAHADAVEVNDGATTEIMLISQCDGPLRGGLDVIGTINHPPEITDLTFEPSKFVATCEGTEVCVTATDPDGDPLEWIWTQTDGNPLDAPVITTQVNPDGSETQCATLLPNQVGSYEYNVEVYDLAYDEQGNIVRIEDLLSAQGDAHESRDSISFPLYSGVECTIEDPDEEEEPCGCTYTQGFYKNHHQYAGNPSQQIPWPISEDTQLCGKSWLTILNTPPAGGDKWYILAHQYITARLNLANGASSTNAVDAALAVGDALLPACSIDPADDATAVAAAETLDDYNNGDIGPGHCGG